IHGLRQASALISTLFWLIQYFVFNAFLALFSLKEIRSILIIPQKNSDNQKSLFAFSPSLLVRRQQIGFLKLEILRNFSLLKIKTTLVHSVLNS
ncbi:MAG: hypothetical protein AAF849_00275, partial [Bacteroidota bacterium]